MPNVETSTPPNTPTPIGPYSHIAKVGQFITIGAIAGVDPATGQLAGNDVASQTRQIIRSSGVMLESVGSDLNHVIRITVFLKDMRVFEAMDSSGIAGLTEVTPDPPPDRDADRIPAKGDLVAWQSCRQTGSGKRPSHSSSATARKGETHREAHRRQGALRHRHRTVRAHPAVREAGDH